MAMSFARIWLGLNGLLFLVYGLLCGVDPSLPAGYAGMHLPGASARTEVAAMYGGLQAAVGAWLVASALRPERVVPGLRVLVVVLGGLALGRAFGLAAHGATAYNLGAVAYEGTVALLGLLALRLVGTPRTGVPA